MTTTTPIPINTSPMKTKARRTSRTIDQLDRFGPERCDAMGVDEARAWCRALALGHYENFSVLSRFVPADRCDDFAAVYAFCRWADDLGDEAGAPERCRSLLRWWRDELDRCMAGEPRHPVFIALRPTMQRFDLPRAPFADLIDAFTQDQDVTRYRRWEDVVDYCSRSANPVGRLVLMLLEAPRDDEALARSDDICTALQLANHWQDVRRDLLERDRIYLPAELFPITDFETRLRASAEQRFAVDQTFLGQYRTGMRTCVDRTWKLFESGEPLLERLDRTALPIVWLFTAGGRHILHQIEMWNYETCLHRPRLDAWSKGRLLLRAWWLQHTGKAPEHHPA